MLKLSAESDTIWVDKAEKFNEKIINDPIISTSGENPAQTFVTQTFDIGDKEISASWSYEAYKGLVPDSGEIELPYLTLGELKLVDVNVEELPDASIPDKMARIYEITVKFSQEVVSVNAPEEIRQPIEYIVKYIGVMEVYPVDVTYRKDYVWEEAHDNLPACNRYILYSDVTCSDGSTATFKFIGGLSANEWGG